MIVDLSNCFIIVNILCELLSERKLSVGSRGAESAAQADQARRADSQAGAGAAQTQGKQRQVEHPLTSHVMC